MYGSVPETKKDAGSTSTNRSRYYLSAAVCLLAAAAVALGPGRRVVKSLLYTKTTIDGRSYYPGEFSPAGPPAVRHPCRFAD